MTAVETNCSFLTVHVVVSLGIQRPVRYSYAKTIPRGVFVGFLLRKRFFGFAKLWTAPRPSPRLHALRPPPPHTAVRRLPITPSQRFASFLSAPAACLVPQPSHALALRSAVRSAHCSALLSPALCHTDRICVDTNRAAAHALALALTHARTPPHRTAAAARRPQSARAPRCPSPTANPAARGRRPDTTNSTVRHTHKTATKREQRTERARASESAQRAHGRWLARCAQIWPRSRATVLALPSSSFSSTRNMTSCPTASPSSISVQHPEDGQRRTQQHGGWSAMRHDRAVITQTTPRCSFHSRTRFCLCCCVPGCKWLRSTCPCLH